MLYHGRLLYAMGISGETTGTLALWVSHKNVSTRVHVPMSAVHARCDFGI